MLEQGLRPRSINHQTEKNVTSVWRPPPEYEPSLSLTGQSADVQWEPARQDSLRVLLDSVRLGVFVHSKPGLRTPLARYWCSLETLKNSADAVRTKKKR